MLTYIMYLVTLSKNQATFTIYTREVQASATSPCSVQRSVFQINIVIVVLVILVGVFITPISSNKSSFPRAINDDAHGKVIVWVSIV